jgi:hypothetical protein
MGKASQTNPFASLCGLELQPNLQPKDRLNLTEQPLERHLSL